MSAKFIVFDGIDGVGKTSTALALTQYLIECRIPTLYTYEPFDNFLAPTIQGILQGRLSMPPDEVVGTLFAASRFEHLTTVILPALKDDITVICDRYLFSTLVYNTSEDYPITEVYKMHKDFYLAPDLVLWFDLPVMLAIRRKKVLKELLNINLSLFDMDEEFLLQAQQKYSALFAKGFFEFPPSIKVGETFSPVVHLVTSQKPQEILQRVLQSLKDFFPHVFTYSLKEKN